MTEAGDLEPAEDLVSSSRGWPCASDGVVRAFIGAAFSWNRHYTLGDHAGGKPNLGRRARLERRQIHDRYGESE